MDERTHYAGFWRRFIALVIDYNIVAICLFPFFIILGYLIPDQVVVNVPFDLFSTEEILNSEKERNEHPDGSVSIRHTSTIKKDVLGKWTYFYEESEENIGNQTEKNRVLIDPESGNRVDKIDADDFMWLLLIIYWTWMESSKYKASLGKMALGIEVTDASGQRLSWIRSLSRNVSKFLSIFTLLIGFMMAGWTRKKQGLHDIVSRCFIVLK